MRRHRIFAGILLSSLLAMAACSGTSTGGGNGTPAASATTAATATTTPSRNRRGLPEVTQAYCQNLMSLSEANTLMSPKSPATTLQASYDSSNLGYGVCNYMAGSALVLKIFLSGYYWAGAGSAVRPSKICWRSLRRALRVTINSATTVSGVGDQAAYLDVTSAGGWLHPPRPRLLHHLRQRDLRLPDVRHQRRRHERHAEPAPAMCQQVVSRTVVRCLSHRAALPLQCTEARSTHASVREGIIWRRGRISSWPRPERRRRSPG